MTLNKVFGKESSATRIGSFAPARNAAISSLFAWIFYDQKWAKNSSSLPPKWEEGLPFVALDGSIGGGKNAQKNVAIFQSIPKV